MPMTCGQLQPLLAAYVDAEASANERALVEAHLATCPPCRRAAELQRVMRRALSTHAGALTPAAPLGLSTRIAARMAAAADAEASRPSLSAFGWRPRLSAFAAALLFVLAVGAIALPVVTGWSTVVLAAQLALDHLKCFVIEPHDHGETVSPAEAQTELRRDYGWDLPVPSTAGLEDTRLVAVRRCLYGEGRAAHLLYGVGGEPVSLFILPGVQRRPTRLSLLGQDEIVWAREGRTYLLVGASSLSPRLEAMAARLRNGAE